MINFFKNLFGGTPRKVKEVIKPKPELPLSEPELAKGIALLVKNGYYLPDLFTSYQYDRSPVKCVEKFSGWGYVEGRTTEYRMGKRVSFVLADDDMEFSEYCVLIDGVPSLLISRGSERFAPSGMAVTIISERAFIDSIFNKGWMPMSTVEHFNRLPLPVQTALMPIVRLSAKIATERESNPPVAMEKLLSLEYGDEK